VSTVKRLFRGVAVHEAGATAILNRTMGQGRGSRAGALLSYPAGMQRPARNPTPEPRLQRLKAVRLALLRLHKALIDAERGEWERSRGPATSGELLKALMEDPFFAWLRPFSGLIVAIDEALAGHAAVSEADARAFAERARELVAVDEGDEPTVNRYDLVCRRDPNVLVLHVELSSRIADALSEGPAA